LAEPKKINHEIEIQTDPVPLETDKPEPHKLALPAESDPFSKQYAKFELAAPRDDDTIPCLRHIADEVDDDSKLKDWSISQLYHFTLEAHTRHLIDKNIVIL
jgi:hypothetical protein